MFAGSATKWRVNSTPSATQDVSCQTFTAFSSAPKTVTIDKEILSSDQKIKIIQEPNIEVDGVGFNYNKKTGIIKIYDSVKVHYDK